MRLSPEDTDLLKNPLPIILCYEQSRHIRIFTMTSQEYRANRPLKLGVDIQTIATDTQTNIRRLKTFSDRHHLNLNIISFADLERARSSLTTEHPLSSKQVIKPNYSESNPPTFFTMEQRDPAQSSLTSSSDSDIEKLNEFCYQQQARLTIFNPSALKSLERFQEKAKIIILSTHLSEAGENFKPILREVKI